MRETRKAIINLPYIVIMAKATIKLNVSGKHFEVSCSPVDDRHFDTMIGNLVSDTYAKDPSKSIFFDCNGDIFAHVLNYLRYGR